MTTRRPSLPFAKTATRGPTQLRRPWNDQLSVALHSASALGGSQAPPPASGVSQPAKEAEQAPPHRETKEKQARLSARSPWVFQLEAPPGPRGRGLAQARPLELTTQPLKALKAPETPSGTRRQASARDRGCIASSHSVSACFSLPEGEDTSPKASEKDGRIGLCKTQCHHLCARGPRESGRGRFVTMSTGQMTLIWQHGIKKLMCSRSLDKTCARLKTSKRREMP